MKFGFWKTAEPEVPEQKASAVPVIAYGGGFRAGWGSKDGTGLVRSGFTGNPVGFRAVRMIDEASSSLGLVLQGGQQRFETHPVLSLLRRPNAAQGQAEFFEALVSQVLLSGDGYIEAVGADGVPSELHVLRSDRVSVVPGDDGWPVGYDYTVGGRKHRFDLRDGARPLCHVRSFHPLDDHYGLSPFRAASGAVEVHNAASSWSRALLENAARPSGAIVYKTSDGQGSLSADQYDRLISEMESHHQGARNAGRPMLLEGGLDWKPMGFSPSDMEFQKTKDAAAREIALAFGVPPMLLGIPGDATYANYQEANRAFYRLTVLPMISKVAASLAAWLSELSGEEFELRPNLDQVSALSAERDAQWKRIGEAEFLTEAEKRSLLGLPPRDEADE